MLPRTNAHWTRAMKHDSAERSARQLPLVPASIAGKAQLALLGFALALVVLGLLAPVSIELVRDLTSDARIVSHAYDIRHRIDELKLARSEQKMDYQVYRYSGDEQALAAFEHASDRVRRNWLQVRSAMQSADIGSAAVVESLQRAEIDFMRQTLNLRRSKGERAAQA